MLELLQPPLQATPAPEKRPSSPAACPKSPPAHPCARSNTTCAAAYGTEPRLGTNRLLDKTELPELFLGRWRRELSRTESRPHAAVHQRDGEGSIDKDEYLAQLLNLERGAGGEVGVAQEAGGELRIVGRDCDHLGIAPSKSRQETSRGIAMSAFGIVKKQQDVSVG